MGDQNRLDSLMLLATGMRWSEFSYAVVRPENLNYCAELLVWLEGLGDASAAGGFFGAALAQYGAAVQCIRTPTTTNARQAERQLRVLILRLSKKQEKAKSRLDQEMAAASDGPLGWSTTPGRAIELAFQARYIEAHKLLGRLGDTRTAERCAACAELLESTADRLTEPVQAMQIWLYGNALEQFQWAVSLARKAPVPEYALAKARVVKKLDAFRPADVKPAVEEPPPVDLDQLLSRLEELARARKYSDWSALLEEPRHEALGETISAHFETLGDEFGRRNGWAVAREFYCVARRALFHTDRNPREQERQRAIEAKLDKAEGARIDDKIANPVKVEAIPKALDLQSGLDLMESLALAGRFPEADALHLQLKNSSGQHIGWDSPGRFEALGDHLAVTHPEIAQWSYEKMYAFLRTLPQDCADQAHMNAGLESAILTKLHAVKERIRLSKEADQSRQPSA